MEGRLYASDASFDAAADEDDDRASQAPVYYLEDNRYDPAVQLEEADWEADSTERLQAAMERLDARSKAILTRRWLSEDKATLHELAAEYGVSAERIRQLEKNAMEKIKSVLVA
jgi:RNA polymerase sigma-32 factor